MPEDEHGSFQIGLALSGAISAGAYTAGVLDFLFQALDEWEKEKDKSAGDGGSVPDHVANVQVIAGASAGAIAGALGAVALARGMQGVPFTQGEIDNSFRETGVEYQSIRCVLPALYRAWVTRPTLVAKDGGIDFLGSTDLPADDRSAVTSLLNSMLLDEIKNEALFADADAAPTSRPPYGYLADPLHIYMTVSNLRGLPFRVEFGNSTYGMQTHGDRVHYALTGLGARSGSDNAWINADKHLDLAIDTLLNAEKTTIPAEWDAYGTCALASSAFPIGFASQQLSVPMDQYRDRQYPMLIAAEVRINPDFPASCAAAPQYIFRNIDGGLINNNPFDYAQYALMGGGTAKKRAGGAADRAVVMVAPFPEPPAFLPEGRPEPGLASIIRALFPTLINQARFRASELAVALDPNDYSRFLIAPQRKLPGNNVEERCTIACGVLGGFGGFLDESFRAHDFQLGRRNCQAFLRRTFALPAGNSMARTMAGRPAFTIAADGEDQFPIIPLLGSAAEEVALPFWPQTTEPDLDRLLRRISGRYLAVAPRLVRAQTTSPLLRLLAHIGVRLGRKRLLKYVRFATLSDLVRRDQIAGWELPAEIMTWLADNSAARPDCNADNIRAILAELANPAYDLRTVAGISAKTHLDVPLVEDALKRLGGLPGSERCAVRSAGSKRGEALFTLALREPKGFASWPVIRQLEDWLDPPVTDQASTPRHLGS